MKQHVSYLYGFNLGFAERLVQDVTAEQMVQQPGGVINHPAWALGHLANSANSLAQVLGLESDAPAGWDKTFATGGTPSNDPSAYPSKEEILAELKKQHTRNTAAFDNIDPAELAKPNPNEAARKYFPTVGDVVVFLMTGHEMDHLGQVAAWRRAMGLGSATGN